ncbi:Hsp20 family protein [Candidatus Micrarchaeota archaeon]|nr:Hsp20 family protein [Candidatus Micrarchaeota archaeon]
MLLKSKGGENMALPAVYDPFDEMKRLQREMDEMFSSFFERGRRGRELMEWGFRAPLSDIEDRGDSLELTAELPGMKKDDIKVEVSGDTVSVSAERKDAKEEKEKDYYYCERAYSGYRRVFGLPEAVDPEQVDAEYKDGVLKVKMKKVKKPEEKKKEVEIK